MPSHLFLVENLYNERQDRTRSVTADEEAAGYEAWHVATGRRNPNDRWQPTTENAVHWVRVDAGASVECDVLAIDRGHNLEGKTVKLQVDDNIDFSSPTDVFSVTFPSAASASTSIDASNGAYTEEGAWVKRFTPASSRYWRLHVAAAASYIPQVVGLWLGKAFAPPFAMQLPYEDESRDVGFHTSESDFGWESVSTPWRRRAGHVELRVDAASEASARDFYDEITRHRPFWLVHDTAKAEQACLAHLPAQRTFRGVRPEWFPHLISFDWREWEAVLP